MEWNSIRLGGHVHGIVTKTVGVKGGIGRVSGCLGSRRCKGYRGCQRSRGFTGLGGGV